MPGERLTEPPSMADKDAGNPDRTRKQQSRSVDELSIDAEPVDLNSEVLAHLQVLCEHFEAHVRAYAEDANAATRGQLVDDLHRFRNDVVVLEKTATELVVNELLLLLDNDAEHRVGSDELTRVLSNAVPQLRQHIARLQHDTAVDNALALLSVVNDCRASRDEMLLSDVLVLAAGIELPEAHLVSISDSEWVEQRKLWVDYASEHHATLGQRLLHWWREGRAGAVAPLRRQLDRFAEECEEHIYLRALVPLFESASVVAQAVSDNQLEDGTALRGLFAQLERNVHRCALVASPEDLLPADLLRNFLYYVAQIEKDSASAISLRRQFRLDRVRLVAKTALPSKTTTIGVEYQLINAIRNGISQETKPLRAWLDIDDVRDQPPPHVVRLRVRLKQLEPIFTLMGAKQVVDCLNSINVQLLDINICAIDSPSRMQLAGAFVQMDAQLDQRARESVMSKQTGDRALISGSDMYMDFAIDACLREARSDIQNVADRLLASLKARSFGARIASGLYARIAQVDAALQILPLPEFRPLLARLCNLLELLEQHPERIEATVQTIKLETPVSSKGQAIAGTRAIAVLFVAFDDYLACVLQPQPPAAQFLTDAEELLELLHAVLEKEDEVNSSLFERAPGELSLPDAGGMTLDVDDDVLEMTLDDEQCSMDSTMQFVFQHECYGHLESLDESVRFALTSSDENDSDNQLPNEKMLRALHTLTGSAQTISAADVVSIVQPLQRAALALHREGGYFNVAQVQTISGIVKSLRAMFECLVADESSDSVLEDARQQLDMLLSHQLTGRTQAIAESVTPLSLSPQITSLDDVFADEATEVLERLRIVTRSVQPLTEQPVNEALALLHSLKGSARMAGKHHMSDCAHELEAKVQLMGPDDDALAIFKTGYQSLKAQLLQITAGAAGDSSLRTSDDLKKTAAPIDPMSAGLPGADVLLELATDLTVSQASVSSELARLRDVCRQIESSMFRWQGVSLDASAPSCNTEKNVLADLLTDMEASRTSMSSALRLADRAHQQALRESANLHQSLVRSRLVRLSDIGARMNEVVDDAARICGVSVSFELEGGELMLDKNLFRLLVAPLEHLVRNAVVHGVEPVEQRIVRNKPSEGVVRLVARMDGADLVLCVSDDGRGIDKQALNTLLQTRGSESVGTDAELQALLFSAGFSSVGKADAVAGHGLGLAAVQSTVKQLNGEVRLDATMPQGLCITLQIPQRMMICQVVLVRDGERLLGIPVASVKLVNVHTDTQVAVRSEAGRDIEEVSLNHLLGELESVGVDKPVSSSHAQPSSVILDVHGRLLSVHVQQVVGYRELIAQPLGGQLASLKRYSAGSVLPSGEQVLILDLVSLLGPAQAERSVEQRTTLKDDRPVALIVDNSANARSVVQTMLVKKGIAVQASKDNHAALGILSRRLPAVIIVDTGEEGQEPLELLARIAKEYELSAPPIIVVSERDSPTEREKAISMGAVGYLIKPIGEQALHDALLAAGIRLPDLTIA